MIAKVSMIDWWRCLTAPVLLLSLLQGDVVLAQSDTGKRAEFLDRLIPILYLEADEISADPRISMEYKSWTQWLKQTGELPPDFDRLPAFAGLPDPLTIRENGREIPIKAEDFWNRKLEGALKKMEPTEAHTSASVADLETRLQFEPVPQ